MKPLRPYRPHRSGRDLSIQDLAALVFGCTLAAGVVLHMIFNGEKPSVDEHFVTLSTLAVFFAGIAFTRPVILLIREWRGTRSRADDTEETEAPEKEKDTP